MRSILSVCALGAFAALATAQIPIVIPNGCATAAGNTSNAFPWGSNAAAWPGLRLMCIYDASNFTSQGINQPVLITRLRWRPDNAAGAVTGGTFQQADVRLSTAPMDYTGLTTNFATNHGPDLTTVYSGPVVHTATPGSAAWTVNSWCVDINLTTPFPYDPSAGDLVIDCDYPGGANFIGGTVGQMDVQGTGANAGRIWASAAYPTANGTALNHGVVVEVTCAGAGGYASAQPYGNGCVDQYATFYEMFAANTFDLSNTSLQMIPTGTGYITLPGSNQWWTPVGANLGLTDDSVSAALPLGFNLNYPGGSTSNVYASSNGFVWAQSNANNGCCNGDPGTLVTQGARWCPLWNDLNPSVGGTVIWDQDPANGAAYLTFTGVNEYNTSNPNTFQVAFFASGIVEMRWQSCAVTGHTTLVGWSPGANNRARNSIDISASLPILTTADAFPLTHDASARPVIGTSTNLRTTNVPASSVLGATLLGLVEVTNGIDLTGFGMPGCRQYLNVDSSSIWFPAGGVGVTPFNIPSGNWLIGLQVKSQGAALVPGINPLGALSSNGLRLTLDVN
jgi:hypothetical protein